MNKVLIIVSLLFCVYGSSYAAHRKIDIDTVRNASGGYSFYSTNEDACSYIIRVFFTQFDNLSTEVKLPFTARIFPGKQRLFDISITDKHLPIGFKFYFVSLDGSYKQPLSIHYPYLLPYKAGKEEKVLVEKNTIDRFVSFEPYEDVEQPKSIGQGKFRRHTVYDILFTKFLLHYDDTIYAARKGMVSMLGNATIHYKDSTVCRLNGIELYQGDCSFATYGGVHGILVKKDEWVNAGDPIALAGDDAASDNAILHFNVRYYDINYQKEDTPDSYLLAYHTPLFFTSEAENTLLENEKFYTSIHPEEIITKEMSKREYKQWKKKHP